MKKVANFVVHQGGEVIQPQGQLVVIKGNLTADPIRTEGGMVFIPVAWELSPQSAETEDAVRLDRQGLPTKFVSIKCWEEDAEAAMAHLKAGDRVRIEARRSVDTYGDNRTDEQKAKYPRDGYEYRLKFLEVFFKRETPAPAPTRKKPKATKRKSKKSA